MPVKAKKNKKSAVLECEKCGTSKEFKSSSPAAPELSACEEAEKVGWGYTLGFFSMMMGHSVYCPNCIELKKRKA